jgi:hypothetical protein
MFSPHTFCQTAFVGLSPGRASKADVQRVLGPPVNQVSATLVEYGPHQDAQKVFVQYDADSRSALRIELVLIKPGERSSLIGNLRLPQEAALAKKNANGRLEEYFKAPAFVVFTYGGGDVNDGITRIAYFTADLYDLAVQRPGTQVDTKAIAGIEAWPGQFRCNTLIKQANEAINAKDIDRVSGVIQQVRSMGPNCAAAAPNTNTLYTEILNTGLAALKAQDLNRAWSTFQQAIRFDPNQPGGYTYSGWMQLYTYKDFGAAETAMRAAIERGGVAQFGVSHDHDGMFKTYCQGWLNVSKSRVSFSANEGGHSFDVEHSNVKDVGVNGFVGASFGSYHLKVIGGDGKSRNYNFAPSSLKTAEADIALRLLKSY